MRWRARRAEHVVRRSYARWERRTASELGAASPDWYVPQGPSLVAALLRRDEARSAIRSLVGRRYHEGWDLSEILADLDRLRSSLPARARRSIDWLRIWGEATLSFTDANTRSLMAAACRDGLSGLPNLSFMAVYLEELVGSDLGGTSDDREGHHLIHLRLAPQVSGVPGVVLAEVTASRVIRSVVPPEVIVGHVSSGSFVIALPPLLDPHVTARALQTAFEWNKRFDTVVVTVLALPREHAAVEALVASWRGRALDSGTYP